MRLFRRAVSRPAPVVAAPLAVPGLDLPVLWRASPRARRITLRLDPAEGRLVVTTPPRLARRDLAAFLLRHADWARAQIEKLPPRRPFADGVVIPILGRDYRIRHDPAERRRVEPRPGAPEGILLVGGPAEHVGPRVTAYLKAGARRELAERAQAKAGLIGRQVASVAVRDVRSRWGSCSGSGRLSFSWRLILAPEPVLDYLAAHEVAHLAEMNHGPCFWDLVGRLTADPAAARVWLKRHGPDLHRWG